MADKKKWSNIPKLSAADRKKLGLTGPKSNPVGSGTITRSGGYEVIGPNSGKPVGGSNGSTKPDKEPGWWKKKDASGKSGQDKVVEGLEGASKVMGTMANAHAEANSGLTGGTGGVGKGAAVSSSGVVRDQDYQSYTEKKKKYGLT